MKKDKVVPIVNPALEAKQNFASHVQSIAFNLTLSRRMIDCLEAVRDYGWPHTGFQDEKPEDRELRRAVESRSTDRVHHGTRANADKTFTSHNMVGFMRSLSHRGLIVWNQTPWDKKKPGERTMFLSRAGELVCDLLVEAGLMVPAVEQKKHARR